jgi:hypothetical protein
VSRYQLIAEIVSRYYGEKSATSRTILDVGGLGGCLDQLLPKFSVTILDSEAEAASQHEQKGDGAHMAAIKNGAYDIVVSSDTLEHIPKKDRKNFVTEIIRASKDLVIICAPFADHGAEAEEAALQAFYADTTGTPHRWLKEHKEFGLPREKEITGYFKDCGLSPVLINHNSIELWRAILATNLLAVEMSSKAVVEKSAKINQFYNQYLLFKDFTSHSYRTFIVASKHNKLTYKTPTQPAAGLESAKLVQLLADFYGTVFREYKKIPVVNELAQAHAKLSNNFEQLTTEQQHMLNSKTWRYTEPLRTAVKHTRRSK